MNLIKILSFLAFLFCNVYGQFSVKLIAEGFDKPIFITSNPEQSDILYVVEQGGLIKRIINNNIDEKIFLDIKKKIHRPLFPADEMGFLGFTFHPNFKINRLIFVHYNDKEDNTIISQMRVVNNIVDTSTEKIILKLKQPYSNHNGGSIEFGPDGYLYIALGDGGSAGDPEKRAQDLSNLFGSILRIDINTKKSYLIPSSNPFKDVKDVKSEIWAYGLRNPWRISFDRLNGDIYVGDVGQNTWEEINWLPSNNKFERNFGWNIMEGLNCFPEEAQCNSDSFILPIFVYPNDAKYVKTILGIKQLDMHGCSVTGGYVYRGEGIPGIYGRYFFGDYCTGKIWSFINNNGVIEDLSDHTSLILNAINKDSFYLSSFGEDLNGELFIIDYTGSIYKFVKIE